MFGLAAWFQNWGKDVIFVAGVVTAIGMLSKTKGAKWLWARLVSGPMTEWQSKVIGKVVDDKVALPNGGSSLRDSLDELVVAQTQLTNQQGVLLEWTVEQAERQTEWAEYVGSEFAQVHERIDRLCDEVGRMKQRKGAA